METRCRVNARKTLRNAAAVLIEHVAIAISPMVLTATFATASVDGFVESFDGDGPYSSSVTTVSGFGNPGWDIRGFGNRSAELNGGALVTSQDGLDSGHFVSRDRLGFGSFTHTLLLRDFFLGDVPGGVSPDGISGRLVLQHFFATPSDEHYAQVMLRKDPESDQTILSVGAREGRGTRTQHWHTMDIPEVANLMLSLEFDASDSTVSASFENLDDDAGAIPLGPAVRFDGIVTSEQALTLHLLGGAGGLDVSIDHWSFLPLDRTRGDFNGDGDFDRFDLDLLREQIVASRNNPDFDLTDDNLVNEDDLRFWITDLKQTCFGDANLDGEFASSDLVNIFLAGEYEDDIEGNSTWAEGDWNSDADFTSSDLVLAFVEGAYEQGPRAAVPEPPPCAVMLGIAMLPRRRR